MGLFLTMTSVVGGDLDTVITALRSYAEENKGILTREELTTEDDDCLAASEDMSGVTLLLPANADAWDEISTFLSQQLQCPVFLFHIHDGDLWMYTLYDKGEFVDQFNPIPDYWVELDDKERSTWQGDAGKVAQRIPGLKAAQIEQYLVPWDDQLMESDPRKKAYPTDEFYYGDDWQLVDFMKKLGFAYPINDQGNLIGETFRFSIEE